MVKVILIHFLVIWALAEDAGLADGQKINVLSSNSNISNIPENKIEDGTFFGASSFSRLLYKFKEINLESLEISFDFKTRQNDGLIFYVAGVKKNDFFGVHVSNKKLFFSYKCDDSPFSNTIISVRISDGLWHTVKFLNNYNLTKLTIDDTLYEGSNDGCQKRELVSPFYFGSVDPNLFVGVSQQLESQNKSFIGCLKNIAINGKMMLETTESVGVTPCKTNTEPATFFHGHGSYLITHEHFLVGKQFDVQMKIKPKDNNGILAAVFSNTDFAILQLVNGNVRFTVDNGYGPIKAEFYSPNETYLYDNKWHSIQAFKIKNIIILSVDDNTTAPIIDYGQDIDIDVQTNDRLFIGGASNDSIQQSKGLEKLISYTGCIQDLKINEEEVDFTKSKIVGQVEINTCYL